MNNYNILYLHCHDAGRYIGPYGYNVHTPALNKLAEEGVIFRQAHCGGPTCSPSRACLLTGQSAHSSGMFGLAHRGWTLNDYNQTLMNHLRRHGYHTVLSGKQHIANPPSAEEADGGYDEVLTIEGTLIHPVTKATEFLARGSEKPFFLDVGFHPPHRSGAGFNSVFQPPREDFVMPPPTLPDTPETRRDFALYMASMRSTDLAMGQVLEALERYGYRENTLVICTTDHGIAFPHMKCRLTDHGTGVMLILRGPGGFQGGRAVDSLVSHVDVFPTVCDLLGLETPAWCEGTSFLPLINGDNSNEREAVFSEVNYHAAEEPMRSARTRRWKYIRHYSQDQRTVLPNIDNSLSKLFLYDHGLGEREQPSEELYDLYYDPQEACNLAGVSGYEEALKEMRDCLDQWMRKTDDPLLEGEELPVRENMILTERTDYSPSGGQEIERENLPWTKKSQRNKIR